MDIAVGLYCRDEVHIIAEWICHYKVLGFDRLYLFLNGSSDGTREIIEAIQRADPAFIELIEWPSDETLDNQKRAYDRALDLARADKMEWLLVVDTDEFLLGSTAETVKECLERLQAFAAIGLHWRFYGSSGHVKQPRGLVTENFLRCCDEGFSAARVIKSFVRVPYCQGFWGAHHASFGPEFPYVNCRGELIGWSGQGGVVDVGPPPRFTPWCIGHYFCQSAEQWVKKRMRAKMNKGFSSRSEDTFADHDVNSVLDFTALRYSNGIRETMTRYGLPDPPWPYAVYESVDRFPPLKKVS